MTSQTELLLLTCRAGNSVSANANKYEMLLSILTVANFPLQTYDTNEMIAAAYIEVVMFSQSFSVIEQKHFEMLLSNALFCGTMFSDLRLKTILVD